MRYRLAVFASGSGSNLQSLIDRMNGRADSPAEVVLAVSDRKQAKAIERAADAGVSTRIIPVNGRAPAEVATDTIDILTDFRIDIIALAGYLKLIPAQVIQQFEGRILNIHPALLPSFGGNGMYGIKVHQAVLDAGCNISGVTVHHVTDRYDEGKPIAQWPVPVMAGDSAQALAARVLHVEHVIYALAIEKLARDLEREVASADGADPDGTIAESSPDSGPQFVWSEDPVELELSIRKALKLEDIQA